MLFNEDSRFDEQVSTVLTALAEKPIYDLRYGEDPKVAAAVIEEMLKMRQMFGKTLLCSLAYLGVALACLIQWRSPHPRRDSIGSRAAILHYALLALCTPWSRASAPSVPAGCGKNGGL